MTPFFRKYHEKPGPVSQAEAIGRIMAKNMRNEQMSPKPVQLTNPNRKLYVALGYTHVDAVSGIAELSKMEGDYVLSNPKLFLDDKFKLGKPVEINPENCASLDNVINMLNPHMDYLLILKPNPTVSGDLMIQPQSICNQAYALNRN